MLRCVYVIRLGISSQVTFTEYFINAKNNWTLNPPLSLDVYHHILCTQFSCIFNFFIASHVPYLAMDKTFCILVGRGGMIEETVGD